MVVVGVLNRITFPAFLLFPATILLPHFWRKYVDLLAAADAQLT
jgi:phosphatidylinositol glycan class Z